ncbi:helix-turn-helix transcriptional regulator [Streptomyces griseosporeus]|uniref:helix-turn-helix transcriptional regulator n=1 Tax=Streptomyces griseosporeus TaxID=1910 RepID=UPI0036953A37
MTVQPPEPSSAAAAVHRPAVTPRPLGRDAEIEHIEQCVTRAPGSPQALLLLGEEGIGRTTLLRYARDLAAGSGVLVLSAQGWAADRSGAHACLRQLLAPVQDATAALDATHRRTLDAVLDPAADRPDDAGVRSAVLALVARLAVSRPVLVCVDDAHACDRAFLDLMWAAVRLLGGRAVTVLLTARADAPLPGPQPPGTARVCLGPLSAVPAAALLDRQPSAPTGRRRLRILAEAEGNPLALVELARRAPAGPRGRPLPAHDVFAERLAALPDATGRALLYAAVAGTGEPVAALMSALGTDDLTVWAPAEAAGLVTIAEDRCVLRHPLLRSAVLLRHPASERQRAHRDLAETAAHPEARARHLAAAAVRPGESVAAALADAAWSRGDAMVAAHALERAARLSPRRPQRARRLAAALLAAQEVGDPGWVRDLYGRFARYAADQALTCRAAGALASVRSQEAAQREAFDLLTHASGHFAAAGRSAALASVGLAAVIADRSGLPEHRAALAALLDRARSGGPDAGPVQGTGIGAAAQARVADRTQADSQARATAQKQAADEARGDNDTGAAVGDLTLSPGRAEAPYLHKALEAHVAVVARPQDAGRLLSGLGGGPAGALPGAPDTPGAFAYRMALASVAYHADEAEVCLSHLHAADAALRDRRAFGLRAWSVLALLDTLVNTGRFTQAEALVREAGEQAAILRLPRLQADLETHALTLRALRGAVPAEPWFTPSVWHAVTLEENRATYARLLRARGLACLARGDHDGGWRNLRELFTADGAPLHPFLSPRSVAELAVAAQRTGRTDDFAPVLERVRAEQGDRPSVRMTLLLHHATALAGPPARTEDHFRLALANLEAERWPWERAHARLNYGIWLRRARRTREARQQLSAVREAAERLGAGVLEAAAARELRASGAAPLPEAAGPLEELTAQQRQIVRMAAGGLSNREIGERLYLSPRTVSSHLYNVYPKLGVSRRQQLRDLLQDG